jgi:hypothetical protein
MRAILKRDGVTPVTDRQSNSNQHLLVRELTHIIKHEFTSAIGLVSLAASRSSSDEVRPR